MIGTIVSQTLLNVARARRPRRDRVLERARLRRPSRRARRGRRRSRSRCCSPSLAVPVLLRAGGTERFARLHAITRPDARRDAARCAPACASSAHPRAGALATRAQFAAWALQWLSCYLLLVALGLDGRRPGLGAAAAVLLAVNVTAVLPATPSNVGVFQAACVAVLTGAYGVSTADALGYGIVLQAVEIATAVVMGMPALLNEGLSWREVRLRAMHSTPVRLKPLPAGDARAVAARVRSPSSTRRPRPAGGAGSARGRRLRLRAALRRRQPLHGLDGRPRAAPRRPRRGHRRAATRAPGCRSRSPRPGRCRTAARRGARRRGSSALTRAEKLSLLAGAARTTPPRVITTTVERAALRGGELRAEQLRRSPTSARRRVRRRGAARDRARPRATWPAPRRPGAFASRAGTCSTAFAAARRRSTVGSAPLRATPANDAARSVVRALAGRRASASAAATTSAEPRQTLVCSDAVGPKRAPEAPGLAGRRVDRPRDAASAARAFVSAVWTLSSLRPAALVVGDDAGSVAGDSRPMPFCARPARAAPSRSRRSADRRAAASVERGAAAHAAPGGGGDGEGEGAPERRGASERPEHHHDAGP